MLSKEWHQHPTCQHMGLFFCRLNVCVLQALKWLVHEWAFFLVRKGVDDFFWSCTHDKKCIEGLKWVTTKVFFGLWAILLSWPAPMLCVHLISVCAPQVIILSSGWEQCCHNRCLHGSRSFSTCASGGGGGGGSGCCTSSIYSARVLLLLRLLIWANPLLSSRKKTRFYNAF